MADKLDLTEQVTVFVITTGEPSTSACHKHLDQQDCTFSRDEIRNVTPMYRAFQQMMDRCKTRYYVQVDADMLLSPWAVRGLYEGIKAQGEKCAQYVAWLWDDDVERPIQGVKIYDHSICSKYPYSNSISCEMGQNGDLKAAGYSIECMPIGDQATNGPHGTEYHRTNSTYGLHYASQTPEMAFRRWQRLMQKHRQLPWMGWLSIYPKRLEARWLANPSNEIAKARYLGCVSGLTGEIPTQEMDNYWPNQDYRRISAYVGEYSTSPREMTLYLTSTCNYACSWCKRQKGEVPRVGELTPEMLTRVLDNHPGIKGCCIAGYGEPLTHSRLSEILDLLKARSISIGLITNGSLLKDKAPILKGVGYVSVSLNAINPEKHSKITKTNTWDAVLEGIKASLAQGIRTGISYVCSKDSIGDVPELLQLAQSLGVKFVHLHNLLPHGGLDDPYYRDNVIRANDAQTLATLESYKTLPGASIVECWPEPISDHPPYRCQSPLVSIGVDALGQVSYCRRIDPPGMPYEQALYPDCWRSPTRANILAQCTGDRQSHEVCKGCFGSWRG